MDVLAAAVAALEDATNVRAEALGPGDEELLVVVRAIHLTIVKHPIGDAKGLTGTGTAEKKDGPSLLDDRLLCLGELNGGSEVSVDLEVIEIALVDLVELEGDVG